jgi:tetratricopeptide (TPR) repeat protein
MKLFLAGLGFAALATLPAQGASPVHQMIYVVNAAQKCSLAAENQGDLKQGREACNTALADPVMLHRAALMMDRGIVAVRLGDNRAALADYNGAIALDPKLGEAYVSRAGLLVAMKRYDEAGADINRAMALGATNMHAAWYALGVIAEEKGDIQGAYRDYKQALALKPDYDAAARELARFRTVSGTPS